MSKIIIRQGDVLIVSSSVEEVGTVIKEDEHRTVLAHGEVTGHAHAFYDNSAEIFEGKKTRHLNLVTTGLLKHEEHTHLKVPAGKYDLPRQTQWTDDNEPIRVAD